MRMEKRIQLEIPNPSPEGQRYNLRHVVPHLPIHPIFTEHVRTVLNQEVTLDAWKSLRDSKLVDTKIIDAWMAYMQHFHGEHVLLWRVIHNRGLVVVQKCREELVDWLAATPVNPNTSG